MKCPTADYVRVFDTQRHYLTCQPKNWQQLKGASSGQVEVLVMEVLCLNM